MAHSVILETNCLNIKKGSIVIHVTQGVDKLGRLNISNETIEWVPKNKKAGTKLSWAKFAELVQNDK